VTGLLALDLLVFHRRDHEPTLRESAGWSAFWIGLAIAFNVLIWLWKGHQAGVEFLTGYIVEKSLSMDNIFVFAVIFRFFQVPFQYQYRVLFWGILGAIFTRLAFILAGTALIQTFDWVLPVFGAFLIYTAVKLARHSPDTEVHPDKNIFLRLGRRFLRVSRGDHREHGHAFFAKEGGRWCITPMFLVLLVIESTDILFAVDSVPAIFGITTDPFIVFTSNIFAILGLRALYFLLAGVIEMFRYLHYGLAAILGLVGVKMVAEYCLEKGLFGPMPFHKISPWVSLGAVASILAITIVASMLAQRREDRLQAAALSPQPPADPTPGTALAPDGAPEIRDASPSDPPA